MCVLFSLPITHQEPLFANLNTWACLRSQKRRNVHSEKGLRFVTAFVTT